MANRVESAQFDFFLPIELNWLNWISFFLENRDQPAHLDFETVEVVKIARFSNTTHPNNTIFGRESS